MAKNQKWTEIGDIPRILQTSRSRLPPSRIRFVPSRCRGSPHRIPRAGSVYTINTQRQFSQRKKKEEMQYFPWDHIAESIQRAAVPLGGVLQLRLGVFSCTKFSFRNATHPGWLVWTKVKYWFYYAHPGFTTLLLVLLRSSWFYSANPGWLLWTKVEYWFYSANPGFTFLILVLLCKSRVVLVFMCLSWF